MKNKYIFASILLCSLLIFGCLGPADNGTQTPQQGGTQAQNQTQTQTQDQSGTGNTQGTGSGTQNAFDAASIATYSAAVAAGLPLECTSIVNGETMKFWVKGSSMVMEGSSGGNSFSAIEKNGDLYMELSAQDKATYAQMGMTCDWFLMKGDDSETSSSAPSSIDTSYYEAPNVKWSCALGSFGDEKFATPGKACTGEDLADALAAQYQQ